MPVLGSSLSEAKDNLTQLKDFLAYLATVKGDLSSITAPPFILAPKSAIEISSAWASRHDLFLAPASEPDPDKRALLVAQNYLCSLKHLVGEETGDEAKKPLNPFLGELFLGTFDAKDGSSTTLIAEQVSHHPPVTACFMHNKEHGISSTGFVAQQTSFSPASGVTVKQLGYAIVRFEKYNEEHLMTMPTLYVKGVATGSPHAELGGPSYISTSSGHITHINFEARGALGFGTKNRVNVKVFRSPSTKDTTYHITGQWDGKLVTADSNGKKVGEFQVDHVPATSLSVRPVEQQIPWESRRAWAPVFDGIREGNVEKINKAKTKIEESQRERRAEEQRRGAPWKSFFFASDELGESIKHMLGAIPDQQLQNFDPAQTAGVWNFIGVKEAEDVMSRLNSEEFTENGPASGP